MKENSAYRVGAEKIPVHYDHFVRWRGRLLVTRFDRIEVNALRKLDPKHL